MRLGVNTHSLAESFFSFVAGHRNRALTSQVHKPEVVNFNEQVWSVSDERRQRWFADLTEKQIRRGTHRSTRALQDAIRLYLNENPTPFVWLKTADEILASIARFCLRTSETGH